MAELLDGTALERPVRGSAAAASCWTWSRRWRWPPRLPVPAVYLLEREDGINAFVAGFAPESAVLCVTRGALDVLTRDELQAVVAHELSHVVNGDMAFNARLTVQLQGLVVFSEAGRKLVDFGFGRGDEKGQASIVGRARV